MDELEKLKEQSATKSTYSNSILIESLNSKLTNKANNQSKTIPTCDNELKDNDNLCCVESDSVNDLVMENEELKKKYLEQKYREIVQIIVNKLHSQACMGQEASLREEGYETTDSDDKQLSSSPPLNQQPQKQSENNSDEKISSLFVELFKKIDRSIEAAKFDQTKIENSLSKILIELNRAQDLKMLTTELESVKSENLRLEQRLSDALNELKLKQSETKHLIRKYEDRIRQMSVELDLTRQDNKIIEQNLEQIVDEMKNNENKSSIESQLTNILAELSRYQNDGVSLVVEKHEQQIFSLNKQLEQTKSEKSSTEAQLNEILNELKIYKLDNYKLTEKYEQKLRDSYEILEKNRSEKHSIENELSKVLNEIHANKNELNLNSKQVNSLSDELEKTKEEKSNIEKQLFSFINELKQYQTDNIALTNKYELQIENLHEQLQLFQV
jgi:hypothetical protein